MNSYQLEELIKNIQNMIKCPNCGNSYRKEDINFLGQLNQAVLVQLSCYICKMPVMATIVISGISGSISRTLNFRELEQFSENLPKISGIRRTENIDKPISADEILEMHNFLEDFSGDFESLFNKENK